MGQTGEEAGEAVAVVNRLAQIVDREVARQHGALLEQLAGLQEANARLEKENRKLKVRSDTIDETLRQLRAGQKVRYYDQGGAIVNPEEL